MDAQILGWMKANPFVPVIGVVVLLSLVVQAVQASFYVWYLIVIAAAAAMAGLGGNYLYFYAFLLGMVTAFAEIIGKFKDEPIKSLQTGHAIFYHLLNGAIAAAALKVYFFSVGWPTTDADKFKAVLVAGLGSMLLMRSKFFNIKVGGEDVAFGPEQVIKVFLSFMEGAIDRVRAQSRVDFVRKQMGNIDFDAVYPYCLTMLYAPQTLMKDDREKLLEEVAALQTLSMEKQLKSYRLGFVLLNWMGEDYVSKLFSQPPADWLIKAPTPEKKTEGLLAMLPFGGPKEEIVSYFAYGSSMATRRFRQRLAWDDHDSAKFLETAAPRKCEVNGFELAFNKPDRLDQPTHAYANLQEAKGKKVEGVLYQLTRPAMEFLDRSEVGYRRREVTASVDGKTLVAQAYVAETPMPGLRPSRAYLDVMVEGAREHQLSAEYVSGLETTATIGVETAEVEFPAPPPAQTDTAALIEELRASNAPVPASDDAQAENATADATPQHAN